MVDPQESESTQQLRLRVHTIRVQLIRASRRLGFEHDNGLVKQVRGLMENVSGGGGPFLLSPWAGQVVG